MTPFSQLQVFNVMHAAPNARLEHSVQLADGLSAAVWSNRDDARDYQAPSHHTLSCYISDGTGTFRRQRPSDKGAPDKLCIMPAGSESNWVVNGSIRLAHLYISEEQFALGCIRLLDREPREMQLREATFVDDREQAQRFRQLIGMAWDEPGERLLASSLAHAIVDHAVLSQAGLRQGLRLKGGLAPVCAGNWPSTSKRTWTSRSASASWRCAATSPNTTLRGCFVQASACRRINTCWPAACSVLARCCVMANNPAADRPALRFCQRQPLQQPFPSGLCGDAWRIPAAWRG